MKRLFLIFLLFLGFACKTVKKDHPINNFWVFESFENVSNNVVEVPPVGFQVGVIEFYNSKRFHFSAEPETEMYATCKVLKNGELEFDGVLYGDIGYYSSDSLTFL